MLSAGGPVIAAAAIASGVGPSSFARLVGRPAAPLGLETWLATALAASAVLAVYLAFGLVFDPRYREFATSTLIGPVVGFGFALLFAPRSGDVLSERVFAAILTASAIAILIQERLLNWEALCFVALLLTLAGILWPARAAQAQVAAEPAPAR
jgi:glucan 1,3-beta-glucosidase